MKIYLYSIQAAFIHILLGWGRNGGTLGFQSVSPFAVSPTRLSPLFRTREARTHPGAEAPPCRFQQQSTSYLSMTSITSESKSRDPRRKWFQNLILSLAKNLKVFRRRFVSIGFALALAFLSHTSFADAVTGGRAGGSFGPSSSSRSSSSSYSRSRPSVGRTMYYPRSSPIIIHTSPSWGPSWGWGRGSYRHYPCDSQWSMSTTTATATRPRMSAGEIAVLTTVGVIMISGFVNEKDRRRQFSSPLGPGATMASITVALNIPDRNNPDNILRKLQRLSDRADTTRRKGVQDFVSDVALELLRQENNTVSASTDSMHFSNSGLAQRSFQQQSVRSRSKFERETMNKFGDKIESDKPSSSVADDDGFATKAVVTINLAIEGDSTVLPEIRTRKDFLDSLSKIASDAQVGECLLAGEVLWAPNGPETMNEDDLYADYPNLIPL